MSHMDNVLAFGQIQLRALEPEDIDLLYAWENDSSLWELGSTRVPFSRHILALYLKDISGDVWEDKQVRLIIQTTEQQPVGAVDLYDIDPYHQRAMVGILIHKRSDRRHGYAMDALTALGNYAADVLGLRQLGVTIPENNTASLQLFEKAGYKVTGIRKEWLRTKSGWKDEWFMQKMFA